MSNYKSNHKKNFLAQKGQVAVIVALLMVCLIGMAALVVDLGSMYQKRAFLQTVADSAALAGAQELPDSSRAIDEAIYYADENNVVIESGDVVISKTLSLDYIDTITVTFSDPAPVYFAGVLGINTVDVGASATARVGEPQVYNVAPWAAIVPTEYINNWWDYLVTLEPDVYKTITTYSRPGSTTGNFCAWNEEKKLPTDWYTGMMIYSDRIINGYSFPLLVGDLIYVQEIDMTQTVTPTATRVGGEDPTWANLDTFDTLTYTTVDGVIKLAKSGDTQLVIVPVIEGPGKIEKTSTILAFAPFIILSKTADNTEIYGKFIHQALIVYDGEVKGVELAGLRVIRLVR